MPEVPHIRQDDDHYYVRIPKYGSFQEREVFCRTPPRFAINRYCALCSSMTSLPFATSKTTIKISKKKWPLLLLSVSSAVILLIAVSMGDGYLHYFSLQLPNAVLALYFLISACLGNCETDINDSSYCRESVQENNLSNIQKETQEKNLGNTEIIFLNTTNKSTTTTPKTTTKKEVALSTPVVDTEKEQLKAQLAEQQKRMEEMMAQMPDTVRKKIGRASCRERV